jgi:hypothetical protein
MRRVVFQALMAAAVLLPATQSTAETAADKAMAQEIGQRLKESGRLRNYRIGVKYEDGVAWLSGSTASAAQRDEALLLTRDMPGVAHVVNRLEVAGAPTASDANLAAAFEEAQFAAAAPMERQFSPQAQSVAYNQQMQAAARNAAASQQPMARNNMPIPAGWMQAGPAPAGVQTAYQAPAGGMAMAPPPTAFVPGGSARAASYDNAQMPGYAWPSYASYPNYAALTYPQQYSPSAWPYIGPFYPYPQVPLAWRKVALEWDDGWWFLDFSAHNSSH